MSFAYRIVPSEASVMANGHTYEANSWPLRRKPVETDCGRFVFSVDLSIAHKMSYLAIAFVAVMIEKEIVMREGHLGAEVQN